MTKIISQNEAWGFHGTAEYFTDDQDAAFDLAAHKIAETLETNPEFVRAFLDSKSGRHFADEVSNFMIDDSTISAAIDSAISVWVNYEISSRVIAAGCESYLEHKVTEAYLAIN